jgi:acetylornithine deacetylase
MTPRAIPEPQAIADAVRALEPYMTESLIRLVEAPSPSGREQPAAEVMQALLAELGLESEKLYLDTASLSALPLFCRPCHPDGQRYDLLATYAPPGPPLGGALLFNGHLDVVPPGPESLWSRPPFDPCVREGWIHGRGAGDMKGGLICALAAFKTLQTLGLRPAARIGFNAVVDEETSGNGTLGAISALQNAKGKAGPGGFDAVIIPEPFAETLMAAQVGVCWLTVTLTGRPAHVAYMNQGRNPIEAATRLMAALKTLEAEMNLPENRHPAFAHVEHPININPGTIAGGEWRSSVPCTCTLGIRASFYPDVPGDEAVERFSRYIRQAVRGLGPELHVEIVNEGFKAPGCVFDLEHPAMRQLALSYRTMTGREPERLACTATTDGRHFRLMTDMAVTVFGPEARNIHGIDECVSLRSMQRVTQTLAHFIVHYCGVTAQD